VHDHSARTALFNDDVTVPERISFESTLYFGATLSTCRTGVMLSTTVSLRDEESVAPAALDTVTVITYTLGSKLPSGRATTSPLYRPNGREHAPP